MTLFFHRLWIHATYGTSKQPKWYFKKTSVVVGTRRSFFSGNQQVIGSHAKWATVIGHCRSRRPTTTNNNICFFAISFGPLWQNKSVPNFKETRTKSKRAPWDDDNVVPDPQDFSCDGDDDWIGTSGTSTSDLSLLDLKVAKSTASGGGQRFGAVASPEIWAHR